MVDFILFYFYFFYFTNSAYRTPEDFDRTQNKTDVWQPLTSKDSFVSKSQFLVAH